MIRPLEPAPRNRRLIPERFKRIWALAEYITAHPGVTRSALAHRFTVSERQLQADLTVMRRDLGLPLSRSRGYRLGSDPQDGAGLSLRDVHTLFVVLERAARDSSIPSDELASTANRLVDAFPGYLRPLARAALVPSDEVRGPIAALIASIIGAIVKQDVVKLRFSAAPSASHPIESVVRPEVLLPYQGTWYLIARLELHQRLTMLPLTGLRTVTLELAVR